MDFDSLESAALTLSTEERARLVWVLLESLNHVPKWELDRLWRQEALRRGAVLSDETADADEEASREQQESAGLQ
jgi:hypothetical protein